MRTKIELKDMILSAIFAGLICIMSYIAIPLPFSPVPVTGQTFVIMLAGLTLTTLQASMSVVVFILLGVIGLPVFSGGASGLGVFATHRGGYIIGFLIGVIVITLIRRNSNNVVRMSIAGFIGGILVVYILGVPWLSYINNLTLSNAFTLGALPFIPGDLFKLFAAVTVALALNRQLKVIIQP